MLVTLVLVKFFTMHWINNVFPTLGGPATATTTGGGSKTDRSGSGVWIFFIFTSCDLQETTGDRRLSGECVTENKDMYFCVTSISAANMSFDHFIQVCRGSNNTHNVHKNGKYYQQFNRKWTHNADIKKGLSITMWKMHAHTPPHTQYRLIGEKDNFAKSKTYQSHLFTMLVKKKRGASLITNFSPLYGSSDTRRQMVSLPKWSKQKLCHTS